MNYEEPIEGLIADFREKYPLADEVSSIRYIEDLKGSSKTKTVSINFRDVYLTDLEKVPAKCGGSAYRLYASDTEWKEIEDVKYFIYVGYTYEFSEDERRLLQNIGKIETEHELNEYLVC